LRQLGFTTQNGECLARQKVDRLVTPANVELVDGDRLQDRIPVESHGAQDHQTHAGARDRDALHVGRHALSAEPKLLIEAQ